MSTESSSATNTATSTSSSTETTSAVQSGDSGILSVLVSDPPHLPDNVSALFVTYNDMYVHIAGLPQTDGWIQVSQSGSIQLLGTINIGQTIASSSIPAQDYNMIRFIISSTIVVYNGQNYTALVQNGNLTIHFDGLMTIRPSEASALIVDVSPFVYNFGSDSNPSFIVKPTANSFPAPDNAVTPQMQLIGNRFQFQAANAWFWQYRNSYNQNVEILSANPSSGSVVVSVANHGNQSVTINAIAISPLQQSAASIGQKQGHGQGQGYGGNSSTPNGLSGSAVFLVLPNGTLNQLSKAQYGAGPVNLSSIIWGAEGYGLSAGASVTYSYNGLIQLGLRMSAVSELGTIVSGQQYEISIIGDNACASYLVTAS